MRCLTSVVVACVLTACGGGGSGSSTTPAAPPASPSAPVAPPATPSAPAPTFSVGGGITGYTQAVGLTLVNGSETLPIATNASTFTFSNRFAQNSRYGVTIGNQPTGATCTISNADGAVSQSDVQSVAVSCTPVLRSGPYTVSTWAGDSGSTAPDGVGTAARFESPSGFAKDSAGNMYVSDSNRNTIRKVSPSGAVTTLAGSGSTGLVDGTGDAAQFAYPAGLAVDDAGNVYVADSGNRAVRKISASGVVSTLARGFGFPVGIAVDRTGNVYISDQDMQTIQKISSTGEISRLAGDGTPGFADGSGTGARFHCPNAMAIDNTGNLFVSDGCNFAIRKVTPTGTVTTVVGRPDGHGIVDGVGSAARFAGIGGLAFDSAGNLYVSDSNALRKVTPGNVVTTLAGNANYDYRDGDGGSARFGTPRGLVVDTAGTIYVADSGNHVVRKVSPTGQVATWLGQVRGDGFLDATGTAARFNTPNGVAADGMGNVYVADTGNRAIRKITHAGVVTTLAGGGSAGQADGTGAAAQFTAPGRMAADTAGNVYVIDGNLIRKVSTAGAVTTLQALSSPRSIAVDGAGTLYIAAGGSIFKMVPGNAAASFATGFISPKGIAVDSAGNVYVADSDRNSISRISAQGQVAVLAGGTSGFADGVGTAAKFSGPLDLAVDGAGNVYVTGDLLQIYYSHVGFGSQYYSGGAIRKITSAGVVTTIAGNGWAGRADGRGNLAQFDRPTAIAADAAGTVYVVEAQTNAVRKVAQ